MAGHIYNELIITFTDNNETGNEYEADITAENIVEESMKLTQSICDENYLKFGGCIASEFSIDLINTSDRVFTQSLIGRWISVKLIKHTISNRPVYPSSTLYPSNTLYPGYEPDETPYYIFSGFIKSAKLSENDNSVRTIVAYDALAILHATDATNYVYSRFKDTSTSAEPYRRLSSLVILCLNRTFNGVIDIPSYSFDEFFRDTYTNSSQESKRVGDFLTDNVYWINNEGQITFGQLFKSVCEIISVFGIIIPDDGIGKFKMINLTGTTRTYNFYESLQVEGYNSSGYTKFEYTIHDGTDPKSGKTLTSGNPSTYNKEPEQTYDFSQNILINMPYNVVSGSRTSTEFDNMVFASDIGYRLAMNSENGDCAFDTYRPLKATVEGTPEQILGSPITIIANKTNPDGSYVEEGGVYVKEYINTYVFKRTLSGIQALTDEIEVKGQR